MIGMVDKKARLVAVVSDVQRAETKKGQFSICRRYIQLPLTSKTLALAFFVATTITTNGHDRSLYPSLRMHARDNKMWEGADLACSP